MRSQISATLKFFNEQDTINVLFIACVLTLGIILKLLFSASATEDLLFVLSPVNSLVEVFTSSNATYVDGKGFWYADMNVVIDKSCAGINFLILCFCITACSTAQYYKSFVKWTLIPFCLVLAYVLTVGVNSCRIISAITLLNAQANFAWIKSSWFHEALGSVFYLTFLIATFLLVTFVHRKPSFKNENSA
jgi:exosortase K